MLTESDKQLAALAVSRFGADKARVLEALAAVRRAHALGHPVDFLDTLVEQKVLTPKQAEALRYALDDTHLDPELDRLPTPPPTVTSRNGATPHDLIDRVGITEGLDLRVIGEYRILAFLGEGGMGSVYRAYHEAEDRTVALKVLADPLARNQAYLERFHREATSVGSLNHPNIVRSFGAGHDPATDRHYLVLEYVDGESAQSILERLGRLQVGDAVHIVMDVARALEHVHQRRIIHRDIKPDNILLTKSGVAKLSDLGLAKVMGEVSHLTGTRQGFGTPFYMPYEQAYNARTADARSDIFALGATLYHLVTGEVPFAGDSALDIMDLKKDGDFAPASSHCADVPPELDRILARMMARQPRDRYRTASDLIVDLERSKLAVPVPSFIDPEMAMRDPVVRARLTRPAQPTKPDLALPSQDTGETNGPVKFWYLRYHNREGRLVKGRLATEEIQARLDKGRLTLNVEAAPERDGPYQPLSTYPEFQRPAEEPPTAELETKAEPTKPEPPPAPWWRQWWTGLLALTGVAGGFLAYWVLFVS